MDQSASYRACADVPATEGVSGVRGRLAVIQSSEVYQLSRTLITTGYVWVAAEVKVGISNHGGESFFASNWEWVEGGRAVGGVQYDGMTKDFNNGMEHCMVESSGGTLYDIGCSSTHYQLGRLCEFLPDVCVVATTETAGKYI